MFSYRCAGNGKRKSSKEKKRRARDGGFRSGGNPAHSGTVTRARIESRDGNHRKLSVEEAGLKRQCDSRGEPVGGGMRAQRRGNRERSLYAAEGVCRANTSGQLGLFRHGGARAVVCPAKQDIITGGARSRRDTSGDLVLTGFLYRF